MEEGGDRKLGGGREGGDITKGGCGGRERNEGRKERGREEMNKTKGVCGGMERNEGRKVRGRMERKL